MTVNDIPLCLDLDGTLIRQDTTKLATIAVLKKNPLYVFLLPIWLLRGRAYFKRQLAERVSLDPKSFDYHHGLLTWVLAEKAKGRILVLVSATDERFAQAVATHLGIFDQVLASDGHTNLRSTNKRDCLLARFGVYDYAGNDYPDIPVWQAAHRAIVVCAPKKLRALCQQYKNLETIFD